MNSSFARLPQACAKLASVGGILLGLSVVALLIEWVPPGARRRAVAQRATRWGSRSLLRVIGVSHHVHGQPPSSAALVVGNHLSWLDILVAQATVPCAFVAKREVRAWPVVGPLADALGVVWIDRARVRDVKRVIPLIADRLRSGTSVLLFPEGTTSNGSSVLPFRSALFEAAKIARVGVITVTYQSAAGCNDADALCWYGAESLWSNLWRVVAVRNARIMLTVDGATEPLRERKAAAQRARATILARLMSQPPVTAPPTPVRAPDGRMPSRRMAIAATT